MPIVVVDAIEKRLREIGMSTASSRHLAQVVMDEFHSCGSPPSATAKDVEELTSRIGATAAEFRAKVQDAFGLKPPLKAPARWMQRGDRHPKETPLAFMERVWGRYIRAGLIYQADIRKLGDPDLCPAIRSYCQRHGLKARDYLPPPLIVKLDRSFLSAPPRSGEAARLKRKLQTRASGRRTAAARRGPKPS